MEYRRLGKSGLKLSVFSFGSWVTFSNQLDDGHARDLLACAYEQGVNFFDNAEVYAEGESERIMGNALKRLGWRRDTFCVSSKVFWGGDKPTQMGLSRKHIFDACHAALSRLQVDYLDLFFCHRPDIHTPVEETVMAMSDLVRQGKVMYWGTSEWSAPLLTQAYMFAIANSLVPPSMEQPEYSLLEREKVEGDYQMLYPLMGLGLTTWSPLASGILTGKYNEGIPKDSRMTLKGFEWLRAQFESSQGQKKIEKAKKLTPIARELGVSLAQLSLAWCLKNPNVSTVILGASKLPQLQENLKALDVVPKLTTEIVSAIEKAIANRPEPPVDYMSW